LRFEIEKQQQAKLNLHFVSVIDPYLWRIDMRLLGN